MAKSILFKGVVCGRVEEEFKDKRSSEIAEDALNKAAEIYEDSVERMRAGFDQFLLEWAYWNEDEHRGNLDSLSQSIFGDQENEFEFESPALGSGIIWARYPFIALRPRFLSRSESNPLSGDAATFSAIEITRPNEFREYFHTALTEALEALEPSKRAIFVGRSTTPIPLTFAIETRDVSEKLGKLSDKHLISEQGVKAPQLRNFKFGAQLSNDLRECFPLPDLLDIDDRFVDGTYKTRTIARENYRFFPSRITEKVDDVCKRYYHAIEKAEWGRASQQKTDSGRQYLEVKEAYKPLTLFSAQRTDYSLGRLNHYTGTRYSDFQKFVLFTNYPDYVRSFVVKIYRDFVKTGKGKLILPRSDRTSKVREIAVGNVLYERLRNKADKIVKKHKKRSEPKDSNEAQDEALMAMAAECACQMPAFHYVPFDNPGFVEDAAPDWLPGISLVNIGVGPSNAKNICDHIAVLRSSCWLMLGHCAGIRRTQEIGEYVLASGYERDDHCMERVVRASTSIPSVLEVEEALVDAVRAVTWRSAHSDEKRELEATALGLSEATDKRELKKYVSEFEDDFGPIWNHPRLVEANSEWAKIIHRRLRIGKIITTDDRNWELLPFDEIINWMDETRAVAVDMESATIAASGYRYRIPYGTLLCVSDKPLYGELKLEGMAAQFYKNATAQHLDISLQAFKFLAKQQEGLGRTRKLNGVDDPHIR